ncbi:MAG TPA: hypothetical protein VGF36_15820, partial [Rhodopila sp.]
GFQRYSGLQLNDGRPGSFSVFDSKHAAEQVASIARKWMQSRPELTNYHLDIALQGEIGLMVTATTPYTGRQEYAVARLYRTDASIQEVNAAIEREGLEAIHAIPGMLRYMTVKLEDGRIATFNAFETEQSARTMSQTAKDLRMKSGSLLHKVFPHDPEVLEGKILFTYRK